MVFFFFKLIPVHFDEKRNEQPSSSLMTFAKALMVFNL